MAEITKLKFAIALNIIIFVATTLIVASYFLVTRKGEEKPAGTKAFRFFTTDSNIFSALACGIAAILELKNYYMREVMIPHWAVLLKYYSAGAVTLTFLTVLFYLGPRIGYKKQFGGTSFYTHFLGPALSLIALMVFERGDHINIEETLVGFIPFIAYFWIYLRQVVLTSERDEEGNLIKGWEDFYGFDQQGRWYITTAIMTPIIIIMMFGIRFLYNI